MSIYALHVAIKLRKVDVASAAAGAAAAAVVVARGRTAYEHGDH